MPLKWTSNQTQAKNTPFKGLDIPAVFLNALWLLWKCSEKNLEVGECVGRLMILFNGLRPSFPHFATPANKNSEISDFFLEILENFRFWDTKKHPISFFPVTFEEFHDFFIENSREYLPAVCSNVFLPGSASLWQCFFSKLSSFILCAKFSVGVYKL